MPRTCIRFFALLLLLLVAVPALQAAPLLQEGKKTLYQRVVSLERSPRRRSGRA